MGTVRLLLCISLLAVLAVAQTAQSRWQEGTITSVRPHEGGTDTESDTKQYDISITVADTVYVVLYTERPGTVPPIYREGVPVNVLVRHDTLTLNDVLGKPITLPVLYRAAAQRRTRR